ncbi:hypothetical protein Goklo_025477 [Gossypium klotzschianum]|uniref:Uncharacterized protein n=1 Tax=Gossypium klotzschianum TaxID=34286 RepID=A0A7J8W8X7_9ROSI|nr:hypothetical protein [Gossypium klotzschianum]
MEKRFLDNVEDNATVQTWFETTQWKKGQAAFFTLAMEICLSCLT